MTTAAYSGSILTKKKAELKEIASALGVSDAGTREEVQNRIREYLVLNQASLEDNPTFSGLITRRRKAPQPFIHVHPAGSPASEPAEEISEKRILSSPHSTRSARKNIQTEATPAPDAREVSMMLRKAPISPPEEEPASVPPLQTPHKERNALFTSTPRSILHNIPKPTLELADTTFQTLQTGVKEQARISLLASRSTLSSSLNIWLVTALLELLYILYQVIPWNFLEIHLPRVVDTGSWKLAIPYAPLATFQSSVFWTVILHWSMPTLVFPAVIGCIVSFHPANAASARNPHLLSLDPLTASIMRLAAQYGYQYTAINARIKGIDVIGPQWRILNAAVGVAFAFAEAIFAAPRAFAETRIRQKGGPPRRAVAVEE